MIQQRLFVVNLSGFEPVAISISALSQVHIIRLVRGPSTYAYCREDILKFIDECDQAGVIHIDAAETSISIGNMVSKSVACAHALVEVCAIFGRDFRIQFDQNPVETQMLRVIYER